MPRVVFRRKVQLLPQPLPRSARKLQRPRRHTLSVLLSLSERLSLRSSLRLQQQRHLLLPLPLRLEGNEQQKLAQLPLMLPAWLLSTRPGRRRRRMQSCARSSRQFRCVESAFEPGQGEYSLPSPHTYTHPPRPPRQAASGAALHHLHISEESEASTRSAAQAALADRAAELARKDGRIARLEAELGDAIAALASLPVHASLSSSVSAAGPSSKQRGGAEEGVRLAAPLGLQVSAATGRVDLSRARAPSSFKALTPRPAPGSSASLPLLPPSLAQVGGGSYVVRPLAGSTPSSCSSPGSDRSEKGSFGWRGLDSRESVSRAETHEEAAAVPQQHQQRRPRSLGDLRSWYALQLRHERAEHEGELRKERQRGAAAAAGASARLATLRSDHSAALNAAADAHSTQVRALKAEVSPELLEQVAGGGAAFTILTSALQAATLEAETVAAVQARLDASEARAASLSLALKDVQSAAAAADGGCLAARAGLTAAEERLAEWAASTRELAARAAKAESHAAALEVSCV